jgi:hypothetical protein
MRRWLQVFFWLCFIAFMLPSIPHLANFFYSFDAEGGSADLFWWLTAYAVAISIDGTILWLCHTMSTGQVGKGYRVLTWAFIFLLTAFSWFLNYHDAAHNSSVAAHRLSGAYFADIDPVLASAFPVLVILFTFMSSKILNAKPKTVEEMRMEAEELETRAEVEYRIRKSRAEATARRASLWVETGKALWKEVQTKAPVPTPLPEVSSMSPSDEYRVPAEPAEVLVSLEAREWYTVKEAAEYIGCSERYVRELRAKTPSPLDWNEQLKAFTGESVRAYAASRAVAPLKLVANGHSQ